MASTLQLRAAVRALAAGGVIACPTEAVWGLSCDPDNYDAVARLLYLKQRPVEKGLILVAADVEQLAPLLEGLSEAQLGKLALSWPGPSTWLIPHHDRVPPWIHGGSKKVAVRVSAHKGVADLCRAWGGTVVSTSANPAGGRPARAQFQVQRYFLNQLDAVLPGPLGGSSRPTVIRDLLTDQVLRA